jgi:VanZ like family/Concanavalin A-like lectin/glucanases superfamily
MNHPAIDVARARLIFAACFLVLVCIAVAGLWPFHTPRNAVRWLGNENGLLFERHGAAISKNAFPLSRNATDAGFSLELVLTPGQVLHNGTILCFDSSSDPRAPFTLREYGDSFVIQRYVTGDQSNVTWSWFSVHDVFQGGRQVVVGITSNRNRTDIYVDGKLAGTEVGTGIDARELSGHLVLANSTVDDSWIGSISGLAIYGRDLSPLQIQTHFADWRSGVGPVLSREASPIAFYRFDERSGPVAHNVLSPQTDLSIPEKYFVLHPAFLRTPWEQYSHTHSAWARWGFWKDLAVNVFGFVPVGFVFYAYFCSVRSMERPALAAIVTGLLASFAVEVLQRLLPNRDSGMTDLITNTTGTALGVWLHRSSFVRHWWEETLRFASARLRRA